MPVASSRCSRSRAPRLGALRARAGGLAACLLLLGHGGSAAAATFDVNATGNGSDNSIGDGDCWTGGWVYIGPFGIYECTLRAAIQETNALVGQDRIEFSSVLTPNVFGMIVIAPTSPLPTITDSVVIDGTTAPTYATADPDAIPVIVLDGSLSPSAIDAGILLGNGANGSEILSLSIVDWSDYGIRIAGADDVLIQGNHVGVEHGTLVGGNGWGIHVNSTSNAVTIGPTLNIFTGFTGRGNLIAGNADGGVLLAGPNPKVAGNKIGTDRFGNSSAGFGNGAWGVLLSSTAHAARIGRVEPLVGGGEAVLGNVIAGNQSGGIYLNGTAVLPAYVMANHIGIGTDGTTSLGNGFGPGILVEADDTVVGDVDQGGNVISGPTRTSPSPTGSPWAEVVPRSTGCRSSATRSG